VGEPSSEAFFRASRPMTRGKLAVYFSIPPKFFQTLFVGAARAPFNPLLIPRGRK
jgi:hypothetical protein